MKYFSLNEFDCPTSEGSASNMDSTFLSMVDNAREYAGIPFRITSGFRTKAHNAYVGGVENSSHLYGYAADIACSSSQERELIVAALIKAGFRRLGIAKSFVHCDNDPKKQPAIWLYN